MFFLIVSLFLYNYVHTFAYDDKKTHPDLTRVAIAKSNIDEYLINNLGSPEGINTTYRGKPIVALLQTGSKNEDIPYRAYNHFWNPIHNEGLDDGGWGWISENNFWYKIPVYWHFTGLPNRDWAMGEAQDGTSLDDCGTGDHSSNNDCNAYSWRRARDSYYEALINLSEEIRNQNFIFFYEKFGRVLHLLQDVGVPAHTRNDMFGHLDFTRFEGINPFRWGGNLYEFCVKKKLEKDEGYISDLSQNLIVPGFTEPEHYWDKEIYTGANPYVTLPVNGEEQSGLAEYSNANFLSRCGMFTEDLPFGDGHYFPYPKKSSVQNMPPEGITAEDGNIDKVLYLMKDKDGELVERFAQARYMWRGLSLRLGGISRYYRLAFQLDDKVHESYAEKLIPKTVAYTAGLIDYFFRGTIEIGIPDDGFYALTDDPDAGFTTVKLFAENTTTDGEEMNDGTVELVVKYRLSQGDPFTNAYSNTSGEFFYIVASEQNGVTSIPRNEPVELTFDLSGTPIPLWATDVYLQVIYKGQLGQEADAVAVGFKDIGEPTPIDLFNNMDKICFNGVWETAGSSGLIAYVDNPVRGGNDNGVADEYDVYAHNLQDIYYRFLPIGQPIQYPSPTENHHHVVSLGGGSLNRGFYVLADYEFNYTFRTSIVGMGGDPWDHDDMEFLHTEFAIKNQMEFDGAGYVRYVPEFYAFRGVEKWGGIMTINWPYPDPNDLYACPYEDLE